MAFIPSKYQQDIFDSIRNGVGNLVIKASAGSGKTTTIVQAMNIIPSNRSVLFAAFNVDIVEELKKRTAFNENVKVKTLHSLGFDLIKRHGKRNGKNVDFDEFKYDNYLKEEFKLEGKQLERVKYMVDMSRFYLVDCIRKMKPLALKYDFPIDDFELAMVEKALKWGKENYDKVDYPDMTWLPCVLPMQFFGFFFDFVFIDECQDMNKAQRTLALKCMKNGSRFVAVGDDDQCIYAFMGADPESFSALTKMPNTKVMPLSVTYRCPKSVVKFVNSLVQTIEPWDDNIDGYIETNASLDNANEGDMVLCRTNLPLFGRYLECVSKGKKCSIRGKGYATSLICEINSVELPDELVGKSEGKYIMDVLLRRIDEEIKNIAKSEKISESAVSESQYFIEEHEKIDVIDTVCNYTEHGTVSEMVEVLKKMIESENDGEKGITFSTIHKAKGLEADNVFIIRPDLLPLPYVKTDMERQQERNLMYVAYTRCKKSLNFIHN